MSREIIIKTESLKIPPQAAPDIIIQEDEAVRIGDTHANPLYLIKLLALLGIISITADAYTQLADLYFAEQSDDFSEEDKFIEVMNHHLCFEYNNITLILKGDGYFDRGRLSDDAMRVLITLLYENGIFIITDFSNHDFACFDYFYGDNIREKLKKELSITDADFNYMQAKPGEFYKILGDKQARSGYRLIAKIEMYSSVERCFRKYLEDIIFPGIYLTDIARNKAGDKIVGGSHTIVEFETHFAAARVLGVTPPESFTPDNFLRMCNEINNTARERYFTCEKPTIMPAADLLQICKDPSAGLSPEHPFLRYSHNRPSKTHDAGFTDVSVICLDPTEYVLPCLGATLQNLTADMHAKKHRIMQEWKQVSRIHTHGHEGPLLTAEQEKEIYFQEDGTSRRVKEDEAQKFAEVTTRDPTQSHVLGLANPPGYESYDRKNLDCTLGRDGTECNSITPAIVAHLGPAPTALKQAPNYEISKARCKDNRYRIKQFLLDIIIPQFKILLNTVASSSKNTGLQDLAGSCLLTLATFEKEFADEDLSKPDNPSIKKYADNGFEHLSSVSRSFSSSDDDSDLTDILTCEQILLLSRYKTFPRQEINTIANLPKRLWPVELDKFSRELGRIAAGTQNYANTVRLFGASDHEEDTDGFWYDRVTISSTSTSTC
jgi:hypothetical protein